MKTQEETLSRLAELSAESRFKLVSKTAGLETRIEKFLSGESFTVPKKFNPIEIKKFKEFLSHGLNNKEFFRAVIDSALKASVKDEIDAKTQWLQDLKLSDKNQKRIGPALKRYEDYLTQYQLGVKRMKNAFFAKVEKTEKAEKAA